MIYLQPITFYTILRDLTDLGRTEIAEHPDGAMKAYAARYQANNELARMPEREGWRVDEILMVPPPMTASSQRAAVREEIASGTSAGTVLDRASPKKKEKLS
jgi:hypothetical protein